jgi:hypothetical protein
VTSQSRATTWTIRLGLAATTVIAAGASYLHALDVVQAADGRTLVAWFIPVLADLVIATASANILDASRRGLQWPPLSKVAAGVGIVVTLGANVMAGWPHAVPVWCVNAWPPVAFFLALEQLADHVRRGRGGPPPISAPATPEPSAACGHGPAGSKQEAVVVAYLHGRDCEGKAPSYRQLGKQFELHHGTVGQLVRAGLNGSGPHED